jgi:hypothetical protein
VVGDFLVYKYEVVREEFFPGTLDDFRALMYEIYQLRPEFKSDQIFLQGERTPSEFPQGMARWEITLGGSLEQRGYILARQLPDGTTKLQFAYHSKFKSIGSRFDVDYADAVLKPTYHTSIKSKPMAYNLTSKQKDALKSITRLGRSWREEFYIVWHDPDGISDILDYDGTPPQFSKGDIRALEREGLLIAEFLGNNKVHITLTAKSYEAVDVDFKTIGISHDLVSILFLAADPTNESRLRLGEEYREIQEKLKLAKLRDRFKLELPQLSARSLDISQALLDTRPHIVHFSGHGKPDGALCIEDQVGKSQLVQPDALAALFEQFSHQVNCVILNACYSEPQAKAIAEHINYVIGMNQAIGDRAAIAFSKGFYQALGAGRTIEEAYKLGLVQIRLQNIPEHLTPVLIQKGKTASLTGNSIGKIASDLSPETMNNKQEREGVNSETVSPTPEWQRLPVQQWDRRPANYEPIPLEDPTRGSSQYNGLGVPKPKPILGRDKIPFLLYDSPGNGILGIEVWPRHSTDKDPSTEITPGAQNVFSAFVLVTAGNAWRINNGIRFAGRRIGCLEFYYDKGLLKAVPLILGKNIREWSYKEVRDVGVVDEFIDSTMEQVWGSQDDCFTLDMLRVDFDIAPCDVTMFRVVAECDGLPSGFKNDPPHIRVSGLTYRINSPLARKP